MVKKIHVLLIAILIVFVILAILLLNSYNSGIDLDNGTVTVHHLENVLLALYG